MTQRKKPCPKNGRPDLDALISEATVDCYNESEAHTGFYEMLREQLPFPFTARIIGEKVEVHDIDINREGVVEAICYRGSKQYRVALLSLEIPKSLPHIEWLNAYRKFCRSI